jgi:hypothetical protein
MDIVDALSVNGPLKVTHWDEASDDARMPEQGEYFWRRTYDYTTGVLSVSVKCFWLIFVLTVVEASQYHL